MTNGQIDLWGSFGFRVTMGRPDSGPM
jgi:hypothetical protein